MPGYATVTTAAQSTYCSCAGNFTSFNKLLAGKIFRVWTVYSLCTASSTEEPSGGIGPKVIGMGDSFRYISIGH